MRSLLANPALLPLPALARTNSPKTLLRLAEQIDMIEEPEQQRNLTACA